MPTFGPLKASDPFVANSVLQNASKSRLQALYSDFSRQRDSNPTSFSANVEWWRRALVALVNSGNQEEADANDTSGLVLKADRNLLERLKLEKIGKPLAIGTVINELRSRKVLVSVPEFISARSSIYDPEWLPYRIASFVLGKPFWWALERIGIVGDDSSGSNAQKNDWHGEYVFVELLEKAADAVAALQQAKATGPADAIYIHADFRKTFAPVLSFLDQIPLSETDAKVIIRFLERERRILVVDSELVKFVDRNAFPEERTINPVDRGIAELKSAISNLQNTVDAIQRKMEEHTTKAGVALRQKQKSLALSYLKSRKQLAEVLEKRLASLATLESTMVSIETAAGDVQIMKTYEMSTSALRGILAHPSLQRTNIDQTMDALAEANHAAQDIDSAIRIGGDVALGVEFDEGELEDEWKALIQDIEADKESTQALKLPKVPKLQPQDTDSIEKIPLPAS